MQFALYTLALAAAGSAIFAKPLTPVFPTATGEKTFSAPRAIKENETFDGGMIRYGRGLSPCKDSDGTEIGAVFILEAGATIKNAIIGADQYEGIHCNGPCTIENVWWEDVCEDAVTILQKSGTSRIIGGGARGADDKVVQHDGYGTLEITDFYVEGFGKLWRSCGNCSHNKGPRCVIINRVTATGGKVLAGVNENYGDVATIINSCGVPVAKSCQVYEGCDRAKEYCESTKISSGFDGEYCIDGGGNTPTC